jgi:hypothetical protein
MTVQIVYYFADPMQKQYVFLAPLIGYNVQIMYGMYSDVSLTDMAKVGKHNH